MKSAKFIAGDTYWNTMPLWTRQFTLADLDAIGEKTASEHLGIRHTGIGDDWIEATMPLDSRTRSADGSMHPGALGILAETVGSVAAVLCVDSSRHICLGQILQINHPVIVMMGPVHARACAISILDNSHVWDVKMKDHAGSIIGAARLTIAVLDRRQ
jgi:1,4-dihydroxy-2-naphthoyl-CoA hydrolase